MSLIDQNSAMLSVNKALEPGLTLIDGRTESDWLSFLANFSTLINFYDSNNSIHGNWSPFLLKDPVFLLAVISKTTISRFETPFRSSCLAIETRYLNGIEAKDKTDVAFCFNQLFDQLTNAFLQLEYWTRFMQLSEEEYELKTYLIDQIQNSFSKYFWAVLSMREYLFLSSAIEGIHRVNYYSFNSFNEIIWRENKEKSPFWEVLGIAPIQVNDNGTKWEENPLRELKLAGDETALISMCFATLENTGKEVFDFIKTIIHNAPVELEKVKYRRSVYPDTVLIRTFIKLLQVQQNQLNGIAEKHLRFYYADILKQTKNKAKSDKVYLCATLSKTTNAYTLPETTLFNAGMDAQKQMVIFTNPTSVSLNPAVIAETYTLSSDLGSSGSFYLKSVSAPGTVKKDEDGKVLSWPTFGNNPAETIDPVKTGIAFSSPMLLLREGHRTLVLTMFFSEGNIACLNSAQFFLSTETAWLPVQGILEFPIQQPGVPPSYPLEVGLSIDLPSTSPAIEAFKKNPDGLAASWPMFKMEFTDFVDPVSPPVMINLTIRTSVSGVKSLVLYNDSGEISTKTPYQPFGTSPAQNSNFIIGSNEIFSKPLEELYLSFTWNNLPGNFIDYYQQYNNYLQEYPLTTTGAQKTKVSEELAPAPDSSALNAVLPSKRTGKFKSVINFIGNALKSFFKGIGRLVKFIVSSFWKLIKGLILFFVNVIKTLLSWIAGLIKFVIQVVVKLLKAKIPLQTDNSSTPFNNVCFTVDFFLLQKSTWGAFGFSKMGAVNVSDSNVITAIPYINDATCSPPASEDTLLFSTNGTDCTLTDMSFFAYDSQTPSAVQPSQLIPAANPLVADPSIQNEPLKYTAASTSGFMKMTLTGPPEGFGSGIYSNVISWVALQNATVISQWWNSGTIIQPPNLPFAPKLSSLTVDYVSSKAYDLTQKTADYPIQFFTYTPFETYLIYNNTESSSENPSYHATSIAALQKVQQGVPLFPQIKNKGILFLGLENLVSPNTLSLYFELAANYLSFSNKGLISYYYLGDSGWENLPVVTDTTNSFSCSGILTVNIPGDISVKNPSMPSGKYWLAFSVDGNPSAFSQTVFLQTNGFLVQRNGDAFLNEATVPEIAAGTIKKTQMTVPQIAQINQPFASFGGKAAENEITMNQRVSSRLKTKDRVISSSDYFSSVRQSFKNVFYSKVEYNRSNCQTTVYAVKQYANWKDAGAFYPLLTECELLSIQNHTQARVSIFSEVCVRNFDFQYLQVTTEVALAEDFEQYDVEKKIIGALNIFLSPWIVSSPPQITIDKSISKADVSNLISGQSGVSSVKNVDFKSWTWKDGKKVYIERTDPLSDELNVKDGHLVVSALNHKILFSASK